MTHASRNESALPIEPPELDDAFAKPWSWGKLRRLLSMFGPAAIVASVAIGAGETIVVVRAGAWAGYGLLWLILLSVLVKGVFVTYMLGRYTAISGELIGPRLVKLPGPRGWLLILLLVLEFAATGPLWAVIARPCGELLSFLFFADSEHPLVDPRIFATLFILAALALSMLFTYDRLEKQQLIICSILVVGTVLATLLVRPDWKAVMIGLLSWGNIPELVESAPEEHRNDMLSFMVVTFGYVGGTVLTYMVYPDWISLHGWGLTGHKRIEEIRKRANLGKPADYLPVDLDGIKKVRLSLAPLRWDVSCGAMVLLIVSVSFMLAGATVLYPKVVSGEFGAAFDSWSLLTDQAWIWKSIHPSLVWVYYVCILVALWGTLQAYPDIYARGIVAYGKAIAPSKTWHHPTVQFWTCLYVFLSAIAVLWSGWDFHLLTLIVSFLATTLGVSIAILAALYLNYQLPSAYRTRPWMLACGILSTIILIAVTLISGISVWNKL